MRKFILLAGVLVVAGCSKQPESLPEKPEFVRESRVDLNSPHADGAIIKDVMARAKDVPWRWTNQNPQLRVWVSDTANRKLHAEFAVADATFKETGPIQVTWTVNDKPVETVTYDSPGNKTFDKPVPPAMLKANAENTVGAQIDKVWVSKTDGVKLGLILSQIGLLQ